MSPRENIQAEKHEHTKRLNSGKSWNESLLLSTRLYCTRCLEGEGHRTSFMFLITMNVNSRTCLSSLFIK